MFQRRTKEEEKDKNSFSFQHRVFIGMNFSYLRKVFSCFTSAICQEVLYELGRKTLKNLSLRFNRDKWMISHHTAAMTLH